MCRKIFTTLICIILIMCSAIPACALSQSHRDSQRFIVYVTDGGAITCDVDLYIDLTHDAGIRTRTFTEETYGMVVKSASAPALTSRLNPSMGILEIHTPSTTVQCPKMSTPSVLHDPTWVYYDDASCTKRVGVVVGSEAYASLGFIVCNADTPIPRSGVTEFRGIAKGTKSITAIIKSGYSEEQYTDVKKYVMLHNEAGKLAKSLTEETPYSQLYLLERGYAINHSETEAKEKAKNSYNKNQALLWYARDRGLEATDEQISTYIDDFLEAAKNSPDLDMLTRACSENNMSVREWMENDKETYYVTCTANNIYNYLLEQFKIKNGLLNSDWTEREIKSFESFWEDFIKETIEEYKNTSQYQMSKKKIEDSLELLKNDNIATVKVLKQGDVFL